MEQMEKKMGNLKFLIFVVVVYSFIWTSVDGSSSSIGIKGLPSPPRNLRRSIVGVLSSDREYKVFWSASHSTGGSAVNYTVKLCMNDTYILYEPTNACKWSSNPQCRPTNILSTNKEFFCILDWRRDLFNSCTWFCDYNVCVVAVNDVGNVTTCIFAPHTEAGLATPQPPLDLTTESDSYGVTVKWKERDVWSSYNTIYTVLYHAEKQPNQTKEVKENTLTRLTKLKKFTNYCIYVMVQTLSREGKRSAPSDVLGPRCLKTIAGDPSNPPTVEWDQSMVFPDNADLRNVTVEWKLAQTSSWHGTRGEYRIYCNYHVLKRHGPLAKACEYYSDAATNRTVLQGVNSADSYNVYIEMCNEEKKCSGRGEPYLVKALQDYNSSKPVEQGKLSAKEIGYIVVAVVAGFIAAGVALYFIKWHRERNNRKLHEAQGRLSEILHLGNPGDNHEYNFMEPEVTHQYSRLYRPVNEENA